jgi:hypothetical protein
MLESQYRDWGIYIAVGDTQTESQVEDSPPHHPHQRKQSPLHHVPHTAEFMVIDPVLPPSILHVVVQLAPSLVASFQIALSAILFFFSHTSLEIKFIHKVHVVRREMEKVYTFALRLPTDFAKFEIISETGVSVSRLRFCK